MTMVALGSRVAWRPRSLRRLVPLALAGAVGLSAAGVAGTAVAAGGDHLEQVSPVARVYTDRTDFLEMTGSAAGDVTASLWAVDLMVPSTATGASDSGCQASDFAGFPAGVAALVQRGTCTFALKAANAVAAGAVAVIIFNEGRTGTGLFAGTLGSTSVAVPVLGTTFAVGDELRGGVLSGPTGATVRVVTNGDGPTPAPPEEQLADLGAEVEAMGLPGGTERSLTSKLDAAAAALDRGDVRATCNSLRAFENQVRAQSGKHLSEAQAATLLARAATLRAALGC